MKLYTFGTGMFAAAVLAASLSTAAFARGGDGGAWQRDHQQTVGVCLPIFGACDSNASVSAKHHGGKKHVAKHHAAKHVAKHVAGSCPASIVYTVTTGGRGGNQTRYYTAANYGC